MKRNFIVTSSGLIYACTQLVLQWRGIEPDAVLYTYFTSVVDQLDEFLFDNDVEFDDTIIFIGFNEDIEKQIRKLYFRHKKMKFLNNDDTANPIFKDNSNPLFRAVKTFPRIKELDAQKKKFIKYALDWAKMDYSEESYKLSLCFRAWKHKRFVENFSDGYDEEQVHKAEPDIKPILKTVKANKSNVLKIGSKFYFVTGTTWNIDDYMYRYIPKYGTIGVVDQRKGRVYITKHPDCESNIKGFCEKVLDNVVGYENLCSGDITPTFVKLLKKADKVC